MRILNVGIVGSRKRTSQEEKNILREVLLRRLRKGDKLHLVSGGCPTGADRWAEELAEELKLGITIHYPDKSKLPPNHTRYDYAKICYERNSLIARDCDILIAFPGEGGGTKDTIAKADSLDKIILVF